MHIKFKSQARAALKLTGNGESIHIVDEVHKAQNDDRKPFAVCNRSQAIVLPWIPWMRPAIVATVNCWASIQRCSHAFGVAAHQLLRRICGGQIATARMSHSHNGLLLCWPCNAQFTVTDCWPTAAVTATVFAYRYTLIALCGWHQCPNVCPITNLFIPIFRSWLFCADERAKIH